ncbi:hypothetical protein CPLU01_05877 [Colletotrichum plurivorum]|uniref:Uncharacterized protein n=1 Tax=Colletotrichum plurivorum TaxID=2175906 RepID=A0A8H6KL31_9PEZI|nr:hypothetical protein CPLU01_05877 [Colletotrichum plurivorum]
MIEAFDDGERGVRDEEYHEGPPSAVVTAVPELDPLGKELFEHDPRVTLTAPPGAGDADRPQAKRTERTPPSCHQPSQCHLAAQHAVRRHGRDGPPTGFRLNDGEHLLRGFKGPWNSDRIWITISGRRGHLSQMAQLWGTWRDSVTGTQRLTVLYRLASSYHLAWTTRASWAQYTTKPPSNGRPAKGMEPGFRTETSASLAGKYLLSPIRGSSDLVCFSYDERGSVEAVVLPMTDDVVMFF